MQSRGMPPGYSYKQRSSVPTGSPAAPEKEGVRRCPACNSWVDRVRLENNQGSILLCRQNDWALGSISGYYGTPEPMPDPCEDGHKECWRYKEIGRVQIMRCAFMTQSRSGKRWLDCGHRLLVGQLQGFLSPDKVSAPALVTKDALLLGLSALGEHGGHRQELARSSELGLSALDGALARAVRSGHVKKSNKREPLPVQGSAYRYQLTFRGLMYIQERFPDVLLNESTNGVYHGEDMLVDEYEPTT